MIEKIKTFESKDYSEKLLNQLKKKIVPKIQEVYNNWKQDDDGLDDILGSGGICQDIAGAICDVLSDNEIECTTVSQEIGEQHVYTIAKMDNGVYEIDVSPYTYETGGGYNWKKIPDVIFDESDIIIKRLSSDSNDYNNYLYEAVSDMGDNIQILKGNIETKDVKKSGETSVNSGETSSKPSETTITPEKTKDDTKSFEPKEIFVNVENKDENIIRKIIDNLTFLIKKRNIKNLRVTKIDGILNKLDISVLKFSRIEITMSNNDIIISSFTLNTNKIANIKIMINDEMVFDLDHKSYTLEIMIDKIVDYYKKFLELKKWKIK